ncbi:MAG: hypothetical protein SO170_05390 [Butyribacter sp.]|nr:hypothetical protein [bacterium]MDY3854383.1 hypothetical protein [Butyribacter sp.]
MNTETRNAVVASDGAAQYDQHAKRLLGQKNVLAYILTKTIDEFKGMKPEDVVEYIEGEPKIGVVPVEPGLTNVSDKNAAGNRIVGLNTENGEINEGMIRFDIIFYVRMKDGISQIIINVEAQKDEPTNYGILNRAIFYVSRLISSQKERDFVNTDYDGIRRVFSVWVCMNMEQNSMSHIHLTKDEMLEPYPWKGDMDLLNIVLIGVTNELPEHDERYELHRLIGALLSDRLEESEKLDILEQEYHIPLSEDLRKDVNVMCNLSQGIVDNTVKNIILQMYDKDFTLEQIALATDKTVEEVKEILEKEQPRYLGV